MSRSASADSGRYIDLVVRVCLADTELGPDGRPRWKAGTDEELIRVGGRWDRRKRRWRRNAKATKLLTLRFHRGQEEAARWFTDWLRRFVTNEWKGTKRAWSVLLIGGRRSGKTHLACALMIVFAVVSPRSLQWALSPTLETGAELEENFDAMLPRGWYVKVPSKTGRSTSYRFANGSKILLRSAVRPQRLKAGRVDLALLNEAQELSELAYTKLRAAIADRGGLVVMTANPPDTPAGRWLEDHYTRAKRGDIDGVVFELDPRLNPWINYDALASMAKESSDEKTYLRDVLGLFPPIGDVVMHAWSDVENIRDVPGLEDVTVEVTKRVLGRGFSSVIGVDLQQTPHMAAAVIKFFRDPADPTQEIPWIVDEVVVDDADEDDLIDQLELEGYRGWVEISQLPEGGEYPAACILDASAWWQDGAHTKGRTSDRAFKRRGWVHLYKPQKDSDRNPDIVERVKCCNSRLKSASGRRRLFSCKHNTRTNRAMRSWENKGGIPNKRSDFAHLCDAVSYVIYRFYGVPRRERKKAEYRSVGQRFDRGEQLVLR